MICWKGLHGRMCGNVGTGTSPHIRDAQPRLWRNSESLQVRRDGGEGRDTPVRLLYVLRRRSLLQAQHFVQAVSRRGQFTLRSVLVLHVSGF